MLTLTRPMPTYRTLDDTIFTATDGTDLVNQLRDDSRTPSTDIQDFVLQMARRCKIYSGAEIRTSNPDVFVADLIAAEHLTEVK